MFNQRLFVVLVLAAAAWCEHASASDEPRCRFVDLRSGVNVTIASYYGLRRWFFGRSYRATSFVGAGDLYFARTTGQPSLPCALQYYARSQYPFYYRIQRVGPIQLSVSGLPRSRVVLGMPLSCHHDFGLHSRGRFVRGFCARYGLVSVLAFGPGRPALHVRPYLFYAFVTTWHI